jgi:hypothetical protein
MALAVSQSSASLTGAIGLSRPPALPLRLSAACSLFIDSATAVPAVAVLTDPSGKWSGGLGIPDVPALVGAELALQGVLGPTASAIGVDLTNGARVAVTN